MKKAINLCESHIGKKMDLVYTDNNRISDHIWYISDTRKFQSHELVWKKTHDLSDIVDEILESLWARVGPLSHLQRAGAKYPRTFQIGPFQHDYNQSRVIQL